MVGTEESATRRIKKAEDNVSRCKQCERTWLPLSNFIWKRTGQKILLCHNCAIEYEFEIEKIDKLSKKEKKRLKRMNTRNNKKTLNGNQNNIE